MVSGSAHGFAKHLRPQLQSIRATAVHCQPPPPDKPFHNMNPKDWVYIKAPSGNPLQEKWEGPYNLGQNANLASDYLR